VIYYSKRDVWLVLVVWAALLLPFVLGVYNLSIPTGNTWAGGCLLFVGTLAAASVLLLAYPLYREIALSRSTVRSGMTSREIPF
jgi:hypothetical protein